jgi:oligopeptide/dipeptide ABC transporter ATP-binding protein
MDQPSGGRLEAIAGDPPDLRIVQQGCPFAPRCPDVMDRCRTAAPPLIEQEDDQQVACHLYLASTAEGKAA